MAIVLLFVAVSVATSPALDDPGSEWTAYFEDSGNRTQQIVSSSLLVLAAFAFLVFFWALCERLGNTEEGRLRLGVRLVARSVCEGARGGPRQGAQRGARS